MTASRRRLLKALGIGGIGVSWAGCVSSDGPASEETPGGRDTRTETPTATDGWSPDIPETPPEVPCERVSRPVAEPVDREAALAPRTYPGQPSADLAGEAAVEYVSAFEHAYQQNDQLRASTERASDGEPEQYLTRFDFYVVDSWVAPGPADSNVVRLRFGGSGTVHHGAEFDYVRQYVTYYVDPSRVLRAGTPREIDGVGALDPDPWSEGDPVACFGT